MRISDWGSDVCSSDLPYLVIRFDRVQRLDLVDRAAEVRIALVGFVVDAELVFPAFGANAEYIEAEAFDQVVAVGRSEERRVGKEGGSTCRSRWSPYP